MYVTYGAEAWTIESADEQHLSVFGRKLIRRIYDPVFIDGELKRRSNKEIEELLGHEDRLFGRVVSMSDCRPRGLGFNSWPYPRHFFGSIGSGMGSTQPHEDN